MDFLDRRRAPGAFRSPEKWGPAPIQEIHADLRKLMLIAVFPFLVS